MHLRPFRSTDSVEDLTRLLHRAYAGLGHAGLNYTAVDQLAAVTRARIGRGDCLVAAEGEHVVGTLTYYRPGASSGCDWYERPEVATLGQLGVDPAAQGRGIGRSLLEAAECRAREDPATELALDTAEPAEHLVAWYSRRGFRFVQHAQWSGKTYRSVILSKALQPA